MQLLCFFYFFLCLAYFIVLTVLQVHSCFAYDSISFFDTE